MGVFLLFQKESERFKSQQHSPQRRRPWRHHTLAAGGLEGRGEAQQLVYITGASGADHPQTKIVQPWLINGVFTDGYDAGQMYRLLVR